MDDENDISVSIASPHPVLEYLSTCYPDQVSIAEADENGDYNVPVGEHFGTLVVDRPMQIIGKGRQSVLWHTDQPILIILARGVVLKDLMLELTFDENGTHILYAQDCEPQIDICFPNNLRILPMSSDQKVIKLNQLIAGNSFKLPILFSRQAHWNSVDKPPSNVNVEKLPRNRHHRRGFMIDVQPGSKEGYIVEPLRLSNKDSKQKESLLLFAQVESASAQKNAFRKQLPVLQTPRGRKIYISPTGLEISERQVDFLLNGKRKVQAGLYGYFINENDRQWSFWTPYKPVSHTTINREPIQLWTRTVIDEGNRIGFDGVEFEITKGDSPLQVTTPAPVIIGRVGDTVKIQLKLNASFLQITKTWSGQLESLTDFLDVVSPQIQLSRSQKEIELALTVNKNVFQIDNGEYIEHGALVLHNADDVIFIDLSFDIALNDVMIETTPAEINLELANQPLHAGEVVGAHGKFKVYNSGRLPAKLKLKTKPQYEVPEKAQSFELEPYANVEIPVKFTSEANRIGEGPLHDPQAIVIVTEDGSQTQYVAVKADIRTSRQPILRIQLKSSQLPDFNISAPSGIKSRFRIANEGGVYSDFRLEYPTESLQITNTSGTLSPKAHQECEIVVSQSWLRQLTSTANHSFTLKLWANRPNESPIMVDQKTITLNVLDQYPVLDIEPKEWDLGQMVEGQMIEATQSLVIRNAGNMEFAGRFTTTVDWLTFDNTGHLTIRPGDVARLKLDVTKGSRNIPSGTHHVTNAIHAKDDRLKKQPSFAIRLSVRDATPSLHPHSDIVWLGKIEQGDNKLREGKIVIGNYGYAPWRGFIRSSVEWITTPTERIEIKPNKIATFVISVSEKARQLPHGAYRIEKAIKLYEEGAGNTQMYLPLFLMITRPSARLVADTDVISFGTVVKDGPEIPAKQFVLRNNGTLDWVFDPDRSYIPAWISLSPAPAQISSNSQRGFDVRLLRENLTVSSVDEEMVLVAEDGSHLAIRVSAEVMMPELKVTPEDLVFRVSSLMPGEQETLVSKRQHILRLENIGRVPVVLETSTRPGRGTFFYHSWMTFIPRLESRIEIKPGEAKEYQLSVRRDLSVHGNQPPLRLRVGNQEIVIPVELQ